MIEGITILSEEIVYTVTGWNIFGGVVVIVIALFFLSAAIYAAIEKNEKVLSILTIMLFSMLFGIVGIVTIAEYINRIEYIQYEAIISEEVSLTEFYKRYEIINQKGNIFTIKEMNQEESE